MVGNMFYTARDIIRAQARVGDAEDTLRQLLNLLQVIARYNGIVADPTAGSGSIEDLTDKLSRAAWALSAG